MAGNGLSRRELLQTMGMGALGMAVLSACAPASAPSDSADGAVAPDAGPVTLTWWRWGTTEQSEIHDAALRSVYPELDGTVELDLVIPGDGDFGVAEALRLALASGQDIPNLVRLNRTQMSEFARAGELLELDDAYVPYEDDMYSGALNLAELDGHYYAFPRQIKSKMFFYRADMFDEMGLSVSDIVTKNDFIEIGTAFNENFPDSHLINLGPQPAQYWTHLILSAYEDARMADDDGNFMLADHPAFADMFQFLKDVSDSGLALPIDDWSSDWQQAFADSAIAGSLLSNWMKRFLPGFAPEQSGQWGYALWPELTPLSDQRYGSEGGGAILVVPRRSENIDVAIDYASKLTLDPAGAMAVFEFEGETPLMQSVQDDVLAHVQDFERPEDVSEDEFALHPIAYFGAELMETEFASYETVQVFPFDPSASLEIPIMTDWLYQFLAGGVDLNEALSRAQSDMEGQIGNPYNM